MTMTLEQAIRILHPDTLVSDSRKAMREVWRNPWNEPEMWDARDEATLLACEVMQREVEREKGCDWCASRTAWQPDLLDGCAGSYREPNFCPSCGKPLNGEKPNIARLVLETLDEVGIPYEHGKGEFVFNGLSRDDFLNEGKVDGDELG